ncbi:MAG: ParA family protein [Clostridia bacterium]|nr:ParA family protein [Oscillospiraceae bacterium]MBR3789496.1 ParA family protein [Clostridia bacterium]MBR3810189.1 ParA family protein [Clostridia bacterium]
MAKIISIVNQKGGVGKTTSAVNLVAALGAMGKKVLLIDIDPQGNTTSGYGIQRKGLTATSYELLINSEEAKNAVIKTKYQGVDVIPSNMNLAGAELEMATLEGRESLLKKAIAPIQENYDFVFFDCPPSLGLITINALNASDSFIVPIQCEYYALEGLSQLMATVRTVKRLYNEYLELEGVLLTMYDGRLNLTQQVVDEVKNFFPKKVYATVIPRNVRLSEAPSFGEPVLYYDRGSKGAESYNNLAEEFLKMQK